jgi:cellulose synthase/poly-beta-1,6-N-acetylglucosamine synthase-like glycosyltransferase
MNKILYNISFIYQIFVFAIMMYYFSLSFFGIYIKKSKKLCEPKKSFALVIAAHNEEMVISKAIESLVNQNYPKHLFDIYIIADNCSDKTAKISRQYNVKVFERFNNEKRGKGYALEWMFDILFKSNINYDAIGIFDADNVVSNNFLLEMNSKLIEGYSVVQGYIDSKNPHDSWITEAYSISFWSANRLFQMARSNLGLSSQIGGTGFVMKSEILRKLGWGATCLTEDLEFTCKLVLNDHKVGWAHQAVVYDEKPITLKQSWKQRKRWMQGFSDVSSRFFIKLIKKAITQRDMVALDCALYVVQPFVTLLVGASLLLTFVQNTSSSGLNIFTIEHIFPVIPWKIFSVFHFLLTPIVLFMEKKVCKVIFTFLSMYSFNVVIFGLILRNNNKLIVILLAHILYLVALVSLIYFVSGSKKTKIFIWFLLYSIYSLTWIPITIQGIADKNKKDWEHTKHVRQIGISEV